MLSAETTLLPGQRQALMDVSYPVRVSIPTGKSLSTVKCSKSTNKKRKHAPVDLPDGVGLELIMSSCFISLSMGTKSTTTDGGANTMTCRKQLSQTMQKIAKGSLVVGIIDGKKVKWIIRILGRLFAWAMQVSLLESDSSQWILNL
ncbi:hypothetical protein RJ641_002922, partial [Dillenia turbinata]